MKRIDKRLIRKVAKGKKQLRKVRRQRIKDEIAKYYPEHDFCNGFGGKDYFLP